MERGINKDTLVSFLKLHTFPKQEEEGSKQMKAELWTPGREVEEEGEKEVEETDNGGGGDQWHFQNALFDDIKSSLKGGKSSSSSSMSRRRYACLACGEVKRWDQLTQHYKKMVQWDSMGIPAVPDQKGMGEKVYQHTALFFEKNFSKDKMPTYRDHVPADGPLPEEKPQTTATTKAENVPEFVPRPEPGTGSIKSETKHGFDRFPFQSFLEQQASLASMAFQMPGRSSVADNIFNGVAGGGAFKKEVKESILETDKTNDNFKEADANANSSIDAIDDMVTVKEELMPMCNSSPMFFSPFSLPPRLPLPPPPLHKRTRKRKPLPSSSITSSTPSQSRRFYKCLGCGSSKRWDRLTDHYRKYVVFGPMGQPWVPNLETMTPEQYVHTLAFRDQGFSSDRMPQYRDHAEASQDLDDEFGIGEEGQDSMNDDSQELLAGPVHDTTDSSETVDDSMEVGKKDVRETETLPESPPTEVEKPKPSPHPNMKVFWDSKTFADVKIICNGGVVTAHRLILAARSSFFHQILVDCVNEDFSIIVMPDHSFDDVSAMIQGFYDFKVSRSAFPFNSANTESSQDDDTGNSDDQACPKPCKLAKMNSISEQTNFSTNISPNDHFSDMVGSIANDPGKVSEHRTTTAASDTLDRLIQKEGSSLCPTYSCKIPGCRFSVQNSLMCIKGHILTEHWGNLG